MQYMCKAQNKSPANPKGTLQGTTTTNGIHCHGFDWRIPPPSSKGNRYALMAVCMLTGFTFCIPIKSKKAEDVIKAYTDNICCVFGPSKKILTMAQSSKTNCGQMFSKECAQNKGHHPSTHPNAMEGSKAFTSS